MARENTLLYAFNRGIVSKRALARVDQERLRLSAEVMTNFVPRTVGSMTLRPGTEYTARVTNDEHAIGIPFIYSNSDVAFIECADLKIRPIVNDDVITRNSVGTIIGDGDFASSASWTLTSVGGGTASISSNKLTFTCVPLQSSAVCSQNVYVAPADQNVAHGINIVVERGPVIFRAGSTSGAEDLFATTKLGTGTHSLEVTPTGASLYIELESRVARDTIVSSISVESGVVEIESPWSESELQDVRWTQSADIVFVDCQGNRPRQIERRTTRSWSLVLYDHVDGPFDAIDPNENNVSISIDVPRGNGTLTASKPFFTESYVGRLLRFFTAGSNFSYDIAQDDVSTPAVRVNGVGTSRTIAYTITGTFVGTLTLQKSFVGEDTGFTDVTTFTGTASGTNLDTSDNTPVWYRFTVKEGDYTSGTIGAKLSFGVGNNAWIVTGSSSSAGGRYGVCRILEVTSSTSAEVEVLREFSSNVTSSIFQLGTWWDGRGYPSAPAFHEGRLFHGGAEHIIGSISDAYASFDPGQTGDSGVVHRSIGYGPVQKINFLLPLTRLVLGGQSSEIAIRSSTFDEPLSPTNFALKDISTYGSANIAAVKIDTRGVFVDKARMKVIELAYNVQIQDFAATDFTALVPDLNLENPIKRIFVQRRPDTRVHCIREDGTVAILTTEPAEQVLCWVTYETDGVIEDGFCLPSDYEDAVYYLIARQINGTTHRYWEKWSKEYECVGGTYNMQLDCAKRFTYTLPTHTITDLQHLAYRTVKVWADGRYHGEYSVSAGGTISLPIDTPEVTEGVVGLSYTGQFKSAKLAYAASRGSPISQVKRVTRAGLLLLNTHWQGLEHGRDFENMQNLPDVISGLDVGADTIHEELDVQMFDHPGDWNPDSRVCLRATAPLPCTLIGLTLDVTTNDN